MFPAYWLTYSMMALMGLVTALSALGGHWAGMIAGALVAGGFACMHWAFYRAWPFQGRR